MGTFYRDLPDAWLQTIISHAAVASNGGSAKYPASAYFRAPHNISILSAYWETISADQEITASDSASYRRLTLYNGSTDESGTVVLGSLNLQASLGSNVTRALTLATNPSLSKGEVLRASQVSAGGNHNVNTVLDAGQFSIFYRPC